MPFWSLGVAGSRTCSLRIIAPPRKPGTMPPYQPVVRGLCHDSTPFLLSACGVGTAVVLCDAACCLAQPRRQGPASASRGGTHQAQAHPLPRAPTVCRPDTQTALCPVCARSRASPRATAGATRADAPNPPPPSHGGHLQALLSPCRRSLSRLAGLGQSAGQWPSQWWPLAAVPVYLVQKLRSGAPRHHLSWQAGGAREAGVGGGRAGG